MLSDALVYSYAAALLYLRAFLYVVLVPPPPGGPWEGPDCHVLQEIYDVGPISTRIRRKIEFEFSC